MASFDRGQETVTVTRYRLKTPSNGTELSKMLNAAAKECGYIRGVNAMDLPDDALNVSTGDDEIVIWWEVPGGGEAGHTG